ncbi:MAG: acetylglutamate kinase [Pseudomonadota bacterium]
MMPPPSPPATAVRGGPVVVKLGGDVLVGAALLAVARDLHAAGAATGGRILVVHGGGPQATALSERLGLPPRLVGGRRVTDAPTLDVIKMVVAGAVNVDLVAALRARGVPAVGLHGASGVVRALRRPPRVVAGGGDDPVDFGLVGDVTGFDQTLLSLLGEAGYWPVLACLGIDPAGVVLNINADVVASQLAGAVGAAALVAVTAVGGVRSDRNDPATRLSRLTVSEARAAIQDGTVADGMIPKLEEAFAPLDAGVPAVHIVAPGEIARALEAPGTAGTLLVAG